MDGVKCPKCRGRLETRRDGGDHWIGPVNAGAWCRDCGECWCKDEDFEPLAHFEPRDRLPTPDERQALEAKHGPRAGWMARIKGNEVFDPLRGARRWDERGGDVGWAKWYHTERLNPGLVESYPHVNGRPVGWP